MENGNEHETENWHRHVNYVLPISRPQIPARHSSHSLPPEKGNENVTKNTQRTKSENMELLKGNQSKRSRRRFGL